MGKIECTVDWSNGEDYTVIQVCELSNDGVITVLKDLSLTPDETAALKRALNVKEDFPSAFVNKLMQADTQICQDIVDDIMCWIHRCGVTMPYSNESMTIQLYNIIAGKLLQE